MNTPFMRHVEGKVFWMNLMLVEKIVTSSLE